jgi:hypothetical protein
VSQRSSGKLLRAHVVYHTFRSLEKIGSKHCDKTTFPLNKHTCANIHIIAIHRQNGACGDGNETFGESGSCHRRISEFEALNSHAKLRTPKASCESHPCCVECLPGLSAWFLFLQRPSGSPFARRNGSRKLAHNTFWGHSLLAGENSARCACWTPRRKRWAKPLPRDTPLSRNPIGTTNNLFRRDGLCQAKGYRPTVTPLVAAN